VVGLFLAAKRPGYCVDHPNPCSTEVKEGVQVYIYIPLLSLWAFMAQRELLTYYKNTVSTAGKQSLFIL
jgi:hypothetical protein